jgi:hypothetical protein
MTIQFGTDNPEKLKELYTDFASVPPVELAGSPVSEGSRIPLAPIDPNAVVGHKKRVRFQLELSESEKEKNAALLAPLAPLAPFDALMKKYRKGLKRKNAQGVTIVHGPIDSDNGSEPPAKRARS